MYQALNNLSISNELKLKTNFFLLLFQFAEEEIDVVSVSDKILPTNPSARDRRALQNKITSRMVKTNSTTISRRRISNGSSDDSAYASKNPSEIPSPTISSPTRHAISPPSTQASRKRSNASASASTPDAKRTKPSKSATSSPSNGRAAAAAAKARRQQPTGEVESVERRNLHNDMERQRRIGLKNLFDNLKERVSSLRAKQRAPKVNILREATILCNKLTQQSREHEQQMQRRTQLQQRLKTLREQLAARNSIVYQ